MQVTVNLVVAHGLTPGMTYTLQSFGTGFTGYDGTYTALPGTTGSTLVGTTGAGICPTSPVDTSAHEGTALSGTGAGTITFPLIYSNVPYNTGRTEITTHNGQHICALLGEYGDNSPFPGAHFMHMVDDKGNALPGAPALVPWTNQGTANFTGYTQAGTQSSSATAALQVTALNPYVITGASYDATHGYLDLYDLVHARLRSGV